ncbi:MAG: family 1 glycosylhydrolase [Candidatus Eremiobacteraeota bacterium]|nr:family 1 glycosylhydrolase [Candidatus Eremiobacteraeota bacterium]
MQAFPEVWASPECTVARIDRDRYRDQSVDTGHDRREADVDLLAALGVAASRYPVLWEKVAPWSPDVRDYAWAQRRLERLRALGVEPIVTLLHHGSGPRYTDLVDPAFPALFADYAEHTARRFPWVKRWTPINEPLTTARFSTLYAAWYPNRFFDHRSFGRAIVNEARAIALATDRIRAHVPDASFLLTEDLQSFTAADDGVAAYVAHKRERMYLSCELLQGRIDDGHPMHRYLRVECGIGEHELSAFRRAPRPPDVMGWNYYPNSERWLESDGTGGHRNLGLVDVAPERMDARALLRAAWKRLQLPFALSEVHVLGSERERARWMLQRFVDAQDVRAHGVPIVAFGAWAAFGMSDWVSLLRQRDGICEDGIYTCAPAGESPRPTLLATVVRRLAAGELPEMPPEPGWWERSRAVAA